MSRDQQISGAKVTDPRLAKDVPKLSGHKQTLAGFVPERRLFSLEEVEKQIKSFFEKNKPDVCQPQGSRTR
ncbi:MAG: hypothetical protein ACT4QA_22700 [Panacagrimonas sp.]